MTLGQGLTDFLALTAGFALITVWLVLA